MERPSHIGLRHLALNVRRLDEMKHFYVDLLGFSVEWEPDPDNLYLSSGTDNLALHRSTSVVPDGGDRAAAAEGSAPETGAAAADIGAGQALDHLGLIVRTPGDVDQWAAFLEGRGVTIEAKPRTHRDGARSCYFRDPDGNAVQIIYHPPISGKI
jgi:catechol 2,3-dioxygenase-like lactoylglutathione lyase family enzyme